MKPPGALLRVYETVSPVLAGVVPAVAAGVPEIIVCSPPGPTREPLDPVRYLGNRSSGKMGFAVAAEAAEGGLMAFMTPSTSERVAPRLLRV